MGVAMERKDDGIHGILAPLFDALPVGVVALDRGGRVVMFNRHEEQLAGRRRERVLGRHFFTEVAPCMNVRELAGAFEAGVEGGRLDERVEFAINAPHVEQPRDVVVKLLSFAAGAEPLGLLLVEDVSFQRSVDRMKETLATLLVHDMKNPLAAVMMNLEFIRRKHGDIASLVESVNDGLVAAGRLQGMILNLLDITRLETGTFPVARRPADVASLVGAALAGAAAVATDHGVELVHDVPPALVAEVDEAAIRRVLDNLLENALRHAPRASAVTARARAEGADLVLEVADEGEGVPPELAERIFEKFVQAGAGGADNRGLGLTFVRMAVRAHGGEVRVAPTPGRGATFRVRLPRCVA